MSEEKKSHLMVDIETLGTSADAVVTQVGAVFFDPETGLTGAEFSEILSADRQQDRGRQVCLNTVHWYREQGLKMVGIGEGFKDPYTVISELSHWVRSHACDVDSLQVWCNGASFDFAILSNLAEMYQLDLPWFFFNQRDVRTVVCVAKSKGLQFADRVVSHDALDDCKCQVKDVFHAFCGLSLEREWMPQDRGQVFYESLNAGHEGMGKPWEELDAVDREQMRRSCYEFQMRVQQIEQREGEA